MNLRFAESAAVCFLARLQAASSSRFLARVFSSDVVDFRRLRLPLSVAPWVRAMLLRAR